MTDQSPSSQSDPLAGESGETGYVDPALDDLGSAEGTIGEGEARYLGDIATVVADIGRAAHSPFGDRVVILAGRLADLAREARRRLAEDAGIPEQQSVLDAEPGSPWTTM